MSLRSKIVLIVSLVVVLYAAADHVIQQLTVTPSFAALERDEAVEDLRRVVQAIQSEIGHLDLACRARAVWDDTYRFAAGDDPGYHEAYVRSNLGPTSFRDDQIQLLYVCDAQGKVVWGDIQDPASGERIRLRNLPRGSLSPAHPLLARYGCAEHRSVQNAPGTCPVCQAELAMQPLSGLVMTERGGLLISSHHILRSDGTGPSRGSVLLGRFLDDGLVERLSARTSVGFRVWPLEGAELPEAELALLSEVTSQPAPVVREHDQELLHVYSTFPDIQAAPALLVRAEVEREISARGATSVRYALISTIAAGLLLLLVLLGVLQRTVLTPIDRLTRHAVAIGQHDDTSARLALERADEIGILSREFDRMMDKLALSRAEVVRTARAAGMSEIATGILHNVGNVLNSVNTSATVVADKVRNSKLPKLRRLTQVVEEHASDLGTFLTQNEKGRHVGPYLCELAKLMSADQEALAGELQSLSHGIDHIRELVSSQQSFATRSELLEPTPLAEPIEEALGLIVRANDSMRWIRVRRELEELPRTRIDRHKLVEVLVNLLTNARQSLEEARAESPEILVVLARAGAGRVRLEVVDNGVGIPPENLLKVFNHGFTTKPNGHGFGLHSSANAVKAMGGSLTAHSDGTGRGARFVVELPFAPLETPTA